MSVVRQRLVFEKYLPEKAVDYCFTLWEQLKFDFRITKTRQSKFGDYRFDPSSQTHTISVNHDQSPYAFLITYIHEVAHKVTYDKHRNTVKPHGKEWKDQFKKLMLPLLREDIFPMDILGPLAKHMKNPKASSVADAQLYEALLHRNPNNNGVTLRQIAPASKFLFKKKIYRKIESKRTRSLCEHIETGKRYLISESAPVQKFKH